MPWLNSLFHWFANFGKSGAEPENDKAAVPEVQSDVDPATDPIVLKFMPPRSPPPPPYFPSPLGVIEAIGSTRVMGWIWDANSPNTPQEVEVWEMGVMIAKSVADNFRQDLLDAKKGDGRHGFIIDLPAPIETSLWNIGVVYCRVDAMKYRLPVQTVVRQLD